MSTILKALKKLEERKAAEGRRQGDIAWDILREQPAGPESRTNLLVWFILAFLFAGLFVALVYVFNREPHVSHIESSSTENQTTPVNSAKELVLTDNPRPVHTDVDDSQANSPLPEKVVPEPEIVELEEDITLTLTGIAYHDNDEARIAIVNDLPVMVGTVIEGMVVERIEQDRVVFSREGRLISISLPASN